MLRETLGTLIINGDGWLQVMAENPPIFDSQIFLEHVLLLFYSQTGKRLMAKCRMLLQENEELGKVITSGRTAKLEGEIAVQKQLVQEMKGNQSGNCRSMIIIKILSGSGNSNLALSCSYQCL